VKLEKCCRYIVSFKFGDDSDIMEESVRPPLDRPEVSRRPCSLLEPKPALRYGKVFFVDSQSSIPVEFVKVERVEFVFEDFVQERRLDGRETWVDLADLRGYLTFDLVIVIMFLVLLLSLLNGVGPFQRIGLGAGRGREDVPAGTARMRKGIGPRSHINAGNGQQLGHSLRGPASWTRPRRCTSGHCKERRRPFRWLASVPISVSLVRVCEFHAPPHDGVCSRYYSRHQRSFRWWSNFGRHVNTIAIASARHRGKM
jgi:hypothetical protein